MSESKKSGVPYHEWELKNEGPGQTGSLYTGAMMNLKFFCVDKGYCDFLRQTDPCVPYVHDEKNTRPFVGVLLSVNEIDYFAPLSSPKPKNKRMKNQIDFLKINGGDWGAINFKNMIMPL